MPMEDKSSEMILNIQDVDKLNSSLIIIHFNLKIKFPHVDI